MTVCWYRDGDLSPVTVRAVTARAADTAKCGAGETCKVTELSSNFQHPLISIELTLKGLTQLSIRFELR